MDVPARRRSRAGHPQDQDFYKVLAYAMVNVPSYSLRGGPREILHGIIARGLGLR